MSSENVLVVLVVYDEYKTRLLVVSSEIFLLWAILALLPVGQSRNTVVVLAPGLVGGFKVLCYYALGLTLL